jgi:predicted RNA binding protein YcfA (HicA-like mRNA interferase family)
LRASAAVTIKHAHRPGVVTVAHPQKDVKVGTLRSIEKQSGLRLRKG